MNALTSVLLAAVFLLAGPAVRPLAAADGWVPVGPPGGDILHLVGDPANPQVLWAGTVSAGVFKSVNGGESWGPANQGLTRLGIAALAVAPGQSSILYTVTTGGSVFRSTNGGRSWTVRLDCQRTPRPGGCPPLALTREVAVHPRDPRILYAATAQEVLKSVDGGATWRRTGAEAFNIYSLAIDPRRPEILYAGGRGIFKSTNGGATWTRGSGLTTQAIFTLVIDPRNPRSLLAGSLSGVFRSPDAGAHWRRSMTNLSDRRVQSLTFAPSAGGERPEVWAGTASGVFRSVDGGFTWSRADVGVRFHNVTALVAHPVRPGTLWAATAFLSVGARGVFKTVDGEIWNRSNQGLRAVPAEDLALNPVTPGGLWTASASHGAFRSSNRGRTWSSPVGGLPFLGIFEVVLDPNDPRTVWAGASDGVYVSENGGGFWERRSEGFAGSGGEVTGAFVVQPAPADPSVLYAAGSTPGLFKTVDAGTHWVRLEGPPGVALIEEIHVDLRDPDVVFVVAEGLFVSRDGGVTWEKVVPGAATARIDAFAIDPVDPDVLWAGGDEGIFRSTDGGQAWDKVLGLEVGQIRSFALGSAGRPVWAATSAGAAMSPDGLSNWILVPGLESTIVHEIAVDPHDANVVYAGTYAGLFRHVEGD